MKSSKILRALLALSMLGGALQATPLEDAYRTVMGRTLYMLDDYTLKSGRYTFDDEGQSGDAKIHNISVPMAYYFMGDLYDPGLHPFVIGAVGYSDYEQNNLYVSGNNVGDIDMTSLYFKFGGGLAYTAGDVTLELGASALYLGTDGDYRGNDPAAKELFDGSQSSLIYDAFTRATYHPLIEGYKPYLTVAAHYLTLDYDPSGIGNDHGWKGNLRAGLFTPELTRWWEMPIRAELYANVDAMTHDLGEVMGFDSAFSGGATFYWKVGSRLPFALLKELDITFTIQGTLSNTDMSGYNIGFGLSLMKF
ncbi:hypothetical protein [Nitratifractor sp.]